MRFFVAAWRATTSNTRAYYVAMYPWFGQRVAPDKPQWRFNLEIRRGAGSEASDQFVFSFLNGQHSGTIQTVVGSERMGIGTVRVTRHGTGAHFDVEGRTKGRTRTCYDRLLDVPEDRRCRRVKPVASVAETALLVSPSSFASDFSEQSSARQG